MTPTEIVTGVQSGNSEAETALFRMIWRFRGLRNIEPQVAEDLAQDALIKCWLTIRSGKLRSVEQLAAFCGTVHRNVKLQWLRRQVDRVELPELVDRNTPERELLRNERLIQMAEALSFLDDRDRRIMLRWAHGETLLQIATSIDLTLSGVKTAHFRARQEMRRRMAR